MTASGAHGGSLTLAQRARLHVNLSIPPFSSACEFCTNLALSLSHPSFFQFVYSAGNLDILSFYSAHLSIRFPMFFFIVRGVTTPSLTLTEPDAQHLLDTSSMNVVIH